MSKGPKKQGPTAQEAALADVSYQQWQDYKQKIRPAEKQLAERIKVTDAERANVAGQTNAAVAQAFSGQEAASAKAAGVRGARVGGASHAMSLAGDAMAQADALGEGKTDASLGLKQKEDADMVQLMSFGRQLAADATQSMNAGANRAQALASARSQARFENKMALYDAAGAVIGAGTAKYMNRPKPDTPDYSEVGPRKSRAKKPRSSSWQDALYSDPFDVWGGGT